MTLFWTMAAAAVGGIALGAAAPFAFMKLYDRMCQPRPGEKIASAEPPARTVIDAYLLHHFPDWGAVDLDREETTE